jgi:hypothetical protein
MRSFTICTLHQNIIRVINSKKGGIDLACSSHGEVRNAQRILVGNPEGKTSLGILYVYRIILKWIIGKCDGECGFNSSR